MKFLFPFLVGYILGGIPFSFLLGKLRGVDIRKIGSGNIGATNLARACGKGWGITGFLLDAGKGWVGVWIGGNIALLLGGSQVWGGILGGVGSILGHNWTPFLRFRGGKGVATSAGVFLGLAPLPLLLSVGVWMVIFFISGYVSLASILSGISLPLWMFYFGLPIPLKILGIITTLLIIYRHRENIRRLLQGKELKFYTLWKR